MMALDDESLRREFVRFHLAKREAEYQKAFTQSEPLVTVCMHTYNRAKLIKERSLPSVLAQSYRNLEVVVVGDACTDDTAGAVASFKDPRVRFLNLPERMDYAPYGGWYVAGTQAVNAALAQAQGYFVTHLDDDDFYHPERIRLCVEAAQEHQLDFIFHCFVAEREGGQWVRVESPDGELRFSTVTTSSTFYHRFFKDLPWDLEAWSRWGEPGDWNRYRKLKAFQPRIGYLHGDLLKHHREGGNVYGGAKPAGRAQAA